MAETCFVVGAQANFIYGPLPSIKRSSLMETIPEISDVFLIEPSMPVLQAYLKVGS
jgi:hypothetical protein